MLKLIVVYCKFIRFHRFGLILISQFLNKLSSFENSKLDLIFLINKIL